jgi:hypothetical protein
MAREAMIAEVRRFNRTVTAQVGALDDRFLGRDRPFGEARLLWEVGPDGCSVRALRARLELDSGYLSRLLRSLEGAGLVTVQVSDEDRRSRVVRLTEAGSPSGPCTTSAATTSRGPCSSRSTTRSARGSSRPCARSSGC